MMSILIPFVYYIIVIWPISYPKIVIEILNTTIIVLGILATAALISYSIITVYNLMITFSMEDSYVYISSCLPDVGKEQRYQF